MYHVLVLFLISMAVCYFLGYLAGLRKGKERTNRKFRADRAAAEDRTTGMV